MDYKKAYEEALKRAKKELQTCGSTDCDAARQIIRLFPELKESEDEMVRKEIIDYCHERLNTTYGALPNIETIKRWLTWLEKQEKLPEGCVRKQVAEAKEALYSAPCADTFNGQGITNQVSQSVTKTSDKDWNEIRIKAAIAAMQGLISHQKGYIEAIRFSREIGVDTGNILACTAIEHADALIKKLKGE